MSMLGKVDKEVAAVGSIAFTVIILIILFAKMKESSSVNNADVNSTIDATITALKTPADYFDLILVIVILVGLYMFVRKSSIGGGGE